MHLLPVALSLQSRPVLIVGGGKVAGRKLAALNGTGAEITVVAPAVTFSTDGLIYHAREFLDGDERGFAVVFAATDSAEVNRRVTELARAAGAWCNDASDPGNSDFHTAAVVRRGAVAVGITTGGESPVLAGHARQVIESVLGAEYEVLFEIAAGMPIGVSRRGEFWRRVLAGDVLEMLREGRRREAEEEMRRVLGEG